MTADLRNLFLAFKFAGHLEQIRRYWTEILSFRTARPDTDRDRILHQTLTLYLVTLYDMQPTEVQALSESLPETERDWVDEIPAIFGKKWRREGQREGRAKGRAEGRAEEKKEQQREFTTRTIRTFPDWSNEQVAEFVGVPVELVRQIRETLMPE